MDITNITHILGDNQICIIAKNGKNDEFTKAMLQKGCFCIGIDKGAKYIIVPDNKTLTSDKVQQLSDNGFFILLNYKFDNVTDIKNEIVEVPDIIVEKLDIVKDVVDDIEEEDIKKDVKEVSFDEITRILINDEKKSENTARSYVGHIKHILINVFGNKTPSVIKLSYIEDIEKIFKYCNEKLNESQSKLKINAMKMVYEYCFNNVNKDIASKYLEEHIRVSKPVNKKNQFAEKTEKQLKNNVTPSILIEKRGELKAKWEESKNIHDYTNYVIMCCYTMVPPLRQQDWINTQMSLNGDELEGNYLDCVTKKMHLRKYKTRNSFQRDRVIDIPDELFEIILNYNKYTGAKYLLVGNSLNHGMHPNTFAMRLNRMWQKDGKMIGTQILRSAYVTDMTKDMSNPECEKLAEVMGHSATTQQVLYNKRS